MLTRAALKGKRPAVLSGMFKNTTAATTRLSSYPMTPTPFLGNLPRRNLRLHEYEGFALYQDYRVPIPLGNIAYSAKEALFHARTIARETDYKSKFVVKAQV